MLALLQASGGFVVPRTPMRAIPPQMMASLEASPCIIVPGFGNADIDYKTPLGQDASVGFASVLERRGFESVSVLPVERYEWARVIFGLIGTILWKPWATPEGPAYSWFVNRLRSAVVQAHEESDGAKVLLVAHSAGGWLARALLADGQSGWPEGKAATDYCSGLVTLGSPHYAPPDGTPDVTQGILKYVEESYPGAFLASEGIAYVTVGGDAIFGNNAKPSAEELESSGTEADRLYAKRGEGSAARAAYQSYLMTGGRGDVTGDGVVPLTFTQLDGAEQIVLDGVLHSINEAGTTLPTDRWYGSEGVVDRWLPQVRKAVARAGGAGGAGGNPVAAAMEAASRQLRNLVASEFGAPTNLK